MSHVGVVHDKKSKKHFVEQINLAILRYRELYPYASEKLDIAINPSYWETVTEYCYKQTGLDCRNQTEFIYNGHRMYSALWAGGVSFYLSPRETPDAD